LLSLIGETAPGEPGNATVGNYGADQADANQIDARSWHSSAVLTRATWAKPQTWPGVRTRPQAPPAATKRLVLWGRFLDLHEPAGRPFAERFTKFEAECDRLGAGTAPTVAALAANLRARAETLRFVLSGRGPGERGPLVDKRDLRPACRRSCR
jgi:hypothetical protein